jgi:hypothetical protein
MQLLCDPARKRAVETLYAEGEKQFASPSSGEVIPIGVAIVDRFNGSTGRQWTPRSLSGWTIRAAIGEIREPIAGSFTLTFGANTTTALDYDPTSAEIETALNALASVTSAGGLTVSGSSGFFTITFTAVGARSQITADVSNLAPLSIGETGTLIEGAGGLREVQTLRLLQNPAAYAVLSTDSYASDSVVTSTAVTITVLQVGGGGENHKIRASFSNVIYDGQWTLTVDAEESAFIAWDADADEVTTALEALAAVGADNVTVSKEGDGSYLIGFQGAHANEDMGTITGDGTALAAIPHKIGDLDLRTPGIFLLLGEEESVSTTLEIEGTPPGGYPQKLFRQDVTLVQGVINPSSMSPQVAIGGFMWLSSLTGYIGGTAADLDGVSTVALPVGTIATFVHSTDDYRVFKLHAGTDAESSPNVIRPDDYAASTNEKVWKAELGVHFKVTGTAGAGFIDLAHQSAQPSAPANGVRIFGSNNGLSIVNAAGFFATLDQDNLTADAQFSFPETDGTLVVETAAQILQNKELGSGMSQTHATITYAATTNLDLSLTSLQSVSLTGSVTFTTSNKAAGRSKTVRIIGDGSIRTFTFPAWKFIGAAAPASLAATKTAILTITAFGTADTDIVAAYAVEP